jgi:hypothetical protein
VHNVTFLHRVCHVALVVGVARGGRQGPGCRVSGRLTWYDALMSSRHFIILLDVERLPYSSSCRRRACLPPTSCGVCACRDRRERQQVCIVLGGWWVVRELQRLFRAVVDGVGLFIAVPRDQHQVQNPRPVGFELQQQPDVLQLELGLCALL